MANTTMRKFTVETCGKKVKVEARSPWLAAVKAIETFRFKSIGMLMEVRDADGVEFFVSGIKAAKASGLYRENARADSGIKDHRG